MPMYHVQTFDRIWRQWEIEANSKSEAREKARSGDGENIDWGCDRYNVSAPSAASLIESEEPK